MPSRKSRGRKRVSRPSRPRPKLHPEAPKTHRMPSKRSKSVDRVKEHTARSDMKLTDLQKMAKSLGIPFGGKSKDRLIKEINRYH